MRMNVDCVFRRKPCLLTRLSGVSNVVKSSGAPRACRNHRRGIELLNKQRKANSAGQRPEEIKYAGSYERTRDWMSNTCGMLR